MNKINKGKDLQSQLNALSQTLATVRKTRERELDEKLNEIQQLQSQLDSDREIWKKEIARYSEQENKDINEIEQLRSQLAHEHTNAEAWRLVAKGKEGAYAAMEFELEHARAEIQLRSKLIQQLRSQLAAEREERAIIERSRDAWKAQVAGLAEQLAAEREKHGPWKFNEEVATKTISQLRSQLAAEREPTCTCIKQGYPDQGCKWHGEIQQLREQFTAERERAAMHVRNWGEMLDDKQKQLVNMELKRDEWRKRAMQYSRELAAARKPLAKVKEGE